MGLPCLCKKMSQFRIPTLGVVEEFYRKVITVLKESNTGDHSGRKLQNWVNIRGQ